MYEAYFFGTPKIVVHCAEWYSSDDTVRFGTEDFCSPSERYLIEHLAAEVSIVF
jgi:hypothetical protein